jgi:hypothetical protein
VGQSQVQSADLTAGSEKSCSRLDRSESNVDSLSIVRSGDEVIDVIAELGRQFE